MIVEPNAHRVVEKFLLRKAVDQICKGDSFRNRSASLQDFDSSMLWAFGEAFLLEDYKSKVAGNLLGRIKKLWGLFKKAPEVWTKIKDFLGIQGITDAAKKIKDWAKKGKDALRKALHSALMSNPLTAMYFVPKDKMPNLTDLLLRVRQANPKLDAALNKVNTSIVQPIDRLLERNKILKTLSRPLLAAAFIWIWLNVAEISWDLPSLVNGFTGNISLGELVGSLPESSIGLIVATLLPGLGTFALLPITIMARVVYLLHNRVMEWVKGKGFLVHWKNIGLDRPSEMILVR